MSNTIRVTDLMLNSQLGYPIDYNNTTYQITIDYSGESVLLGTSSIVLYINRKKFCSVSLNNLILTYKREVNDLINNEPKLFSLCIDTFDLLISEDKIDDSRIDQRLLLFIYLMGDLSYLSNQGNITTVSVDKIKVYDAMGRLIKNLTLSRYGLQIHTRILRDYLESVKHQYFNNPSEANTSEANTSEANNSEANTSEAKVKQLTKRQLETELNTEIKKVGKFYYVGGDSSKYQNLSEIAKTYDLV